MNISWLSNLIFNQYLFKLTFNNHSIGTPLVSLCS